MASYNRFRDSSANSASAVSSPLPENTPTPESFFSLTAGKGAHRTVRFRFNGRCVFSSAGGQTKGQRHAQNRREKAAPEQILHHPASFSEFPAAAAAAAAEAGAVPTNYSGEDPRSLAKPLVAAQGWSDSEYQCLVLLWNRESQWNPYAENASSGAYGIPQSLPGSKMASAGADWRTNPVTQINWGIGYIKGRYGTPCSAWAHSNAVGWY